MNRLIRKKALQLDGGYKDLVELYDEQTDENERLLTYIALLEEMVDLYIHEEQK